MSRGSVLPAGLVISGEIRGQGDLSIGGSVEGPVQIDGHLVIEAGATVRGDVKARSMVIRGTLLGPAVADETIKLESGARMVGDARADRVSVVEGALLRGRITMTGAQASRRSSSGSVAGVPSPTTLVDRASPVVKSSSGVLVSPPDTAFAEENRTNRFVKPSDLPMPEENKTNRFVKPADLAAARTSDPAPARPRRPPEPVIPGVGRQRARRKDGGMAS